jgi:hypothetical protein
MADLVSESPPPVSAPPPAAGLDRSLLRGIAWTGGAKWATQLLGWSSTLLVANLLGPDPYGLIGMASVFLGLVSTLTEFGPRDGDHQPAEAQCGAEPPAQHHRTLALGVVGAVADVCRCLAAGMDLSGETAADDHRGDEFNVRAVGAAHRPDGTAAT